MYKFLLVNAVLFSLALGCAWSEVRLANLFSDDMMLQRDRPIAVWGWAAPGEAVTVRLGTAMAETTANADGEWQVRLPALKGGEKLTLTVTGTCLRYRVAPGSSAAPRHGHAPPLVTITDTVTSTITLKNLIVGDIWVCSGQSNMEFGVAGTGSKEDIDSANYPQIRRVKIELVRSADPANDLIRTDARGNWQVCTPATVRAFTAAGYFFAREIYQQTKVPIGIIDDNWGGTPIEQWLTPSALAGESKLEYCNKEHTASLDDYHKKLSLTLAKLDGWIAEARTALADGTNVPQMPPQPPIPATCSLYNAMIHPITRFPIKGALWYQGEANGGDGDIYTTKMQALIGGWRAAWKQGDFSFYFVQLATFLSPNENPAGGDGWAKIRCAQMKALAIPHTGMASAIDIGDAGNIHPTNKQDVGKRLALWALARDYGKPGIVPSGPLYQAMKIEGGKIRLTFDYVGSGLMVGKKDGRQPTVEDPAGKLARFAIAGADKQWVWANAVIDGNAVVVSSDKVPNPVAVRYAFTTNTSGANLYNREGLPASPFRTDEW